MIARLATVIYLASLLIALFFSIVTYITEVETVEGVTSVKVPLQLPSGEIYAPPCTVSPEDERAVNEDRYEDVSDTGLTCLLAYGYLTETETKTVYGDAPFYWLFCLLIALVGYSIRYILTGNKNPLSWRKEPSND